MKKMFLTALAISVVGMNSHAVTECAQKVKFAKQVLDVKPVNEEIFENASEAALVTCQKEAKNSHISYFGTTVRLGPVACQEMAFDSYDRALCNLKLSDYAAWVLETKADQERED